MSKKKLTRSMFKFIDYFAELGARWGLKEDTCRIHALLYLTGNEMNSVEIENHCQLPRKRVKAAIDDLLQWNVVQKTAEGIRISRGEPIDLLLGALEERSKREIEPALVLLEACERGALMDRDTPRYAAERIASMMALVEDIRAINVQSRKLSSKSFARLIGFGGRTARFLNRTVKQEKE